MSDENDAFENVDLGMFNEASEFIMGRQQEEVPAVDPTQLEKKDIDPVPGGESPEEIAEKARLAAEAAKTTEEEIKDIKQPSSDENEKSSRLTPYFKLLMEEGVFDENDEKEWDGTTNGLLDIRHKKQQAQWEQYKGETLDPRTKWLQDNLEQGVALEDLLKVDKESVALDQITDEGLDENIELQKTIAKEYFRKTTRLSPERIEKQIKMLEDTGELIGESKAFNSELKEINQAEKVQLLEQAKVEAANAEKAQAEALTNFKQTLDKTEEVIPGMKVNSIMRDKIYNTLTTSVAVDEGGNPINKIAEARAADPLNFEIKLAYLFELTNGFTDYSALGTTGKKKAFSDFERAAKELDNTSSSTRVHVPATDNEFLNELDKLYKGGTFS